MKNRLPYQTSFPVHEGITKSEKLRSFVAPNMTDLITFLENNGKSAVYTGGYIHGIYQYLEMIVAPTKLTTSSQLSHHFRPSSSRNDGAANIHPVIAALRMIQKSISECCGIIGHKADAYIIRGPKFLPPILRGKMNQFNALHGE